VLTPSALPTLDLVAGFLKANPSALAIEGHAAADERRPDELAHARAEAVRVYLIACGVSGDALVVRSQGSARPACAERSWSCRVESRRVELRFSDAP
jgi:outer membrane protein OmpA-like peptidoglycan-associated protein